MILTIGRELIQDPYAAVVELVKNAYDADSPVVGIEFTKLKGQSDYSIVVSDRGHGMTRDDVINKWMVPSTSDKRKRKLSPSGRVMQGRKGVGRYAASVLGADLLLETVTAKGERTEVYVEWKRFEESEYLDDVDVLIGSSITTEPKGTRLTISGVPVGDWGKEQFDRLRFELRRLKSPVGTVIGTDDFRVTLEVTDFRDIDDIFEVIEPYPILDFFDYRVSGCVLSDGTGNLEYTMQKVRNAPTETIEFDHGRRTGCGDLDLDIRVYDRDSESIRSLIGRGLRDDSGKYLGSIRARQLLNEYNGIGVYRNGFRIRPLGDPEFDWLKLNEQRVQTPALRIGSNQVIGLVQIQSEEESGLIEKSARDGLIENRPFHSLKEVSQKVIGELEWRRFNFRRKTRLITPAVRVERQVERLFSSDSLKRDVQLTLTRSGITKEAKEEILDFIIQDEEERNRVAEGIRQEVAIYQGQATLGKIVNVILHEGRRPLNYFRNEIPNLRYWHKSYLESRVMQDLYNAVSIVEGVGDNAQFLVDLFGRLDPLAARKRSRRRILGLKREIEGAFSIFESEIELHDIKWQVNCPEDFRFLGWNQDIYTVFTNLIDNSLYWLIEKESPDPVVIVDVEIDGPDLLHIDYHDSGPGIDPALIASEVIFEPQFSTKPHGTGIGLALAGEAAARNSLELRAFESEAGAWFRLQSVLGEGNERD